jgi:hypothetical protein
MRQLIFVIYLFLLAPISTHAGDFLDTRITFGISDDNILLGPGQSNPSSPSVSFIPGDRNTLFFDNYNTRFSGFETLSHAVLYKKLPSYFKRLTTEAALVVRMQYIPERADTSFSLKDAGSYILLTYDFIESPDLKRQLTLTTFPLSSDRFRLGYSYRLSWGGDSTFPRRTIVSPVPGFKLQFNYDFTRDLNLFAFTGLKTTFLQKRVTPELIEEETAYGVLGGFGFSAGGFRIEGGAAFFDKGTFANPGVRGLPVTFYGVSSQISYSYGMPIGVSIDFQLYRNDPDMPMRFFRAERYEPGKFSFALSAEFSHITNMLQDAEKLDTISPAPGMAADLNFSMKFGYLRFHADIVFRDLGFILQNVPGFVPFQGFSSKQKISPEFFAAVGIDYYIKPAYLTIGLKGGVMIPATFRGEIPPELVGGTPPSSLTGEQIVVIRDEGDFMLIPTKDEVGNPADIMPVFSIKFNLKWQLSDFLAVVGEFMLSVDNNQTRLERTAEGGAEFRKFIDPLKIGFNAMLQARF